MTIHDATVHDTRTVANRTIYPSFYAAVHRAWNERGSAYRCRGTEPYEPNDHKCYDLASALRVELHAAGIRLSNDGNGSLEWNRGYERGRSDGLAGEFEAAIDRTNRIMASAVVSEAELRRRMALSERSLDDDDEEHLPDRPYAELDAALNDLAITAREQIVDPAIRFVRRLLGMRSF